MTSPDPHDRGSGFLRALALAFGLAYVGVYLFLAVRRMSYPFELEWMEGGAVDHVRRILAGEPLYVAPSLDFVPYTYTPLYFYLSAVVSKLTGVGLFPLRLVSFLASIGSLALIAAIVRRRAGGPTGGRTAPILAAALFAATFRASGAWFDIARVDSLFLVLILAAVAIQLRCVPGGGTVGAPAAGRGRSRISDPALRAGIASGVFLALAFFTKQAGLFIGIPIAVGAIVLDQRMGIACVASAAVLIGGGILLLDRASGGWFTFYVFDLPRLHGIVRRMLLDFWTLDLGRRLLVGCILAGYLLAGRVLGRRERIYYALLAVGMIGGTYAIRVREGSYDNILMPAYALIALLAGIATPLAARPTRAFLVYGAWVAQFALLIYNPIEQMPTTADARAGRALVARIAQVDGPVFIPCHGYLAAMAGKPTHAQMMALGDVLRCDRVDVRDRLNVEVSQAVREHRFGMIIQDGEWLPELERFYVPVGPVFQDETVFWTRTGLRTRPQLLFIPRSRPSS
jgi:hypothetical protein